MTTDDNGEGCKALFQGLCMYWGVRVGEPDEGAADFYLPDLGRYALIVPEAYDRQVEIGALTQHGHDPIMLNREDLLYLLMTGDAQTFFSKLRDMARAGTRAGDARQRAGLGA
jgi:hypothetical protein